MGQLDTPGSCPDLSRREWEPRAFYVFRRLFRWFLWGFVVASLLVYVAHLVSGMTASVIAIALAVLMLVGAAISFIGLVVTAPKSRRDEADSRADADSADDRRQKLQGG